MVIDISSVIGVSPQGNHVATVHFSDPNYTKSGVLFNLAQDNTLYALTQRIRSVKAQDIIGLSALDL